MEKVNIAILLLRLVAHPGFILIWVWRKNLIVFFYLFYYFFIKNKSDFNNFYKLWWYLKPLFDNTCGKYCRLKMFHSDNSYLFSCSRNAQVSFKEKSQLKTIMLTINLPSKHLHAMSSLPALLSEEVHNKPILQQLLCTPTKENIK